MSSAQVEIAIDQSYVTDFLSMTVDGKISGAIVRDRHINCHTLLRIRPVYRKEFPALAALKRGVVFLHMDKTKFYYGHDVHVGAASLHIENHHNL